MTNSPTIHVSNIGPVVEFELEMNTPGLWVLRGRQGSGKSTIIRTADLLVNGASGQQLSKRDGAKRGEATVRLAKLGGGLTVAEAQAKAEDADRLLAPAERARDVAKAKDDAVQQELIVAKNAMIAAGTAKGEAAHDLSTIEQQVRNLESQLATAREGMVAAKARYALIEASSDHCDARFLNLETAARGTERALTLAANEFVEAFTASQTANNMLESAKREASLHAELMAAIDASASIVAPTEQELAMAESGALGADVGVDLAKDAITLGTKVRAAHAAKELADQHMAKAARLKREAEQLRDAARDTSNVLTNAIATINDCPLRVKITDDGDPRLVVSTDRSDSEYLEDLSDGEKWLLVVKIAAAHNRLIVLSQSAFGELSPESKAHIDQVARDNQCWILTAEAVDCELMGAPYRA